MPTVITEEPTTGPDTFILRRLRKGTATVATGVYRLREDGLWQSDRLQGEVFTWAFLTENPHGHEVTIELLAVPAVETPVADDLNLPDIERRMGLWINAEYKWTSPGGRALAIGLIKADLPKLIALVKAAAQKAEA